MSKEKTNQLYNLILKVSDMAKHLSINNHEINMRMFLTGNKFKNITILVINGIDIEHCSYYNVEAQDYYHEYDYARFEIKDPSLRENNINRDTKLTECNLDEYHETVYGVVANLNDKNKDRLIEILEAKALLIS